MCAQVLLLAHLNISTAGGLFRDDDGVRGGRSRVGSHGMRKSGTIIIIIVEEREREKKNDGGRFESGGVGGARGDTTRERSLLSF